MVCPKCGMKISGKRDRCNHCGAPIPAELGGDRPDPIYDDEYDWLNADGLKASAAENEAKSDYAPRREERELAEQDKQKNKEKRPTNKGLIILLVMASLVLLIMALLLMLYLKWDVTPEIEHTAEETKPPVYNALEPTPEPADIDISYEPEPSVQPSAAPETGPVSTPEPAPTPTPVPVREDDGNYLLSESNSRYLTRGDLAGLSQQECCLARNEIYARHGRIFVNGSISRYFNSKDWYSPTVSGDDFRDSVLNEYELANVKLISDYEQEKWGGSYY